MGRLGTTPGIALLCSSLRASPMSFERRRKMKRWKVTEKDRLKAAQKRFFRKQKSKPVIPEFYKSEEWIQARYAALKRSNGHCQCCGAGPEHGAVLNVDHIKPRKRYPDLALEVSNLQVLCAKCNKGKGGRDQTDWRKPTVAMALDLDALADLRERGLLN